ncbi:MAG: hypothetical protein OHK0039_09480 [Bacteroidia bacterium]
MLGTGELILIALVVASIVGPYLNRRARRRQAAAGRAAAPYRPPLAREVDYEPLDSDRP